MSDAKHFAPMADLDMGSWVPDDASELLIRQRAIAHTQNVSGHQSRRYLCHLQSTVSSIASNSTSLHSCGLLPKACLDCHNILLLGDQG